MGPKKKRPWLTGLNSFRIFSNPIGHSFQPFFNSNLFALPLNVKSLVHSLFFILVRIGKLIPCFLPWLMEIATNLVIKAIRLALSDPFFFGIFVFIGIPSVQAEHPVNLETPKLADLPPIISPLLVFSLVLVLFVIFIFIMARKRKRKNVDMIICRCTPQCGKYITKKTSKEHYARGDYLF